MWMAVFTCGILIATICYTVVSNRQLKAIEQQVNYLAAEDRPYVSMKDLHYGYSRDMLNVTIHVENFGKTPALYEHTHANILTYFKGAPPIDARTADAFARMLDRAKKAKMASEVVVAPGQVVDVVLRSSATPSEVLEMRAKPWTWVVVGVTKYTDDATRSYSSTFCLYDPGPGKEPGKGTYCPAHNVAN
jgi:hypothetical protein